MTQNYVVAEVQTMSDGTVAVVNPVEVFSTSKQAKSRWHQIMSVAEASGLPCHGAIIFDNKCTPFEHDCSENDDAQTEAS